MAQVDIGDPRANVDLLGGSTHELGRRHYVVVHLRREYRFESSALSLTSDVLDVSHTPPRRGYWHHAKPESLSVHCSTLPSRLIRGPPVYAAVCRHSRPMTATRSPDLNQGEPAVLRRGAYRRAGAKRKPNPKSHAHGRRPAQRRQIHRLLAEPQRPDHHPKRSGNVRHVQHGHMAPSVRAVPGSLGHRRLQDRRQICQQPRLRPPPAMLRPCWPGSRRRRSPPR